MDVGHQHGYPDNEREWFDDLLGRGNGDPDVHPNPAELDEIMQAKGEWFINEDGVWLRVATTEDIAANLIEQALQDAPF